MLWAAIVSILATFRVVKAKGADGHEIDVKEQFTTGLAMFVTVLIFPLCDLIHISDTQYLSAVHLSVVLHIRKGCSGI
jgi:hypothetical protein